MRVVIIGATGHIGGYLVPRLVEAGHDVIALSRQGRPRYHEHPSWAQVTSETVDRDSEEAAGNFGPRVADLEADVVVDLICFEPDSARQLVEALRPKRTYLVHCGTIWARPEHRGADNRGRSAPAIRPLREGQGGDRGDPVGREPGRWPASDPAPPRAHRRTRAGYQ
jgi:nucleoside-diphosphate-sugar epimerase